MKSPNVDAQLIYSLDEVDCLIEECLYYLKLANTDDEVEKRAEQYLILKEYKKKYFG